MRERTDTIFALSSGRLPSGIAVVRLSGPHSAAVCGVMAGGLPVARKVELRDIRSASGELLDTGLVVWMPGPSSFTGEDVLELHLHGGPAVVDGVLEALSEMEGCRLAEAGEFSLRAFENGRIDLTEAEGLSDLLSAQTAVQRRQALVQAQGGLRHRLDRWRERIIGMRAMIEAGLDFADEEDVAGLEDVPGADEIGAISREIADFIGASRGGEIVRDGFRVVLAGPPNAGKSSLMNALARRDVAIVDEQAGTTRDVLDVHLDLGGFEILLRDTAGIRDTHSRVEAEGIRRALAAAGEADLVLWLAPEGEETGGLPDELKALDVPVELLVSKDDRGLHGTRGVSVRNDNGLDGVLALLREKAELAAGNPEEARITRQRHREALLSCQQELENAHRLRDDPVLCSEHLRVAGDHLGKLTGRIDVEDLLDVIFSRFCIGK